MKGLSFNAEKHEYSFDGRPVPNVTTILDPVIDLSMVHPDVLARACEFGNHVHTACELFDLGELDVDALDPALVPYLNGWKKFLMYCNPVFSHIEEKVFSKLHFYAGTLDRAGVLYGKKAIIDIKTGLKYPSTGPQTAAYQQGAKESLGLRTSTRFTVLLRPDDFKLIKHTDKNDLNTFLSCLNIHNFNKSYKPQGV
jgi:hypothetical protein